ncbi:uncharacterized protein LOC143237295 isoform X1 [Tachypleus tridentatus]|uniref:uncharacterized protein LOC143237295 isoform X1 n=1 Tax=Tachypleus tridentatus TaxID=6853 RepID=UPI003FD22C98
MTFIEFIMTETCTDIAQLQCNREDVGKKKSRTPSHWGKMFDKVFAFFSHHYIRDFRKLLKVFREILKPEGYVICLGIASAHTFSAWLELSTKEEWNKYLIVSRKVFCLKKLSNKYHWKISTNFWKTKGKLLRDTKWNAILKDQSLLSKPLSRCFCSTKVRLE